MGTVCAGRGGVFGCVASKSISAGYLIKDVRLAAHVDGMVFSADLGARKRDPLFYARAVAVVDAPRFGSRGIGLMILLWVTVTQAKGLRFY